MDTTNPSDKGMSTTNHGPPWPIWWNADNSTTWERVKEAMRRDWMQTRNDFNDGSGKDLDQSLSDTVSQAVGQSDIPPRGIPNPPESAAYDSVESALRYGFGAASHYASHVAWDPSLETKLDHEWTAEHPHRPWAAVREDVQRGWDRFRVAQANTTPHR
jgi:hypothetical protein